MLLPVNIRSTTICNITREIKAETEVKIKIEIKDKIKV
jgi:hypothetical protein